ncbi:MAG: flagellar M-ring protein FliF [Sphingomonadaceae bacterium]|nr:flagellar M-ring protein FliF [Sphingomonadaceae bacterium]
MADASNPAIASQGNSLPVPFAGMSGIADRIMAFTRQPAIAKSIPTLMLIGLLGLAALAWSVVHQPPQKTLFANMADGDKAAVADALGSAGIKYTIDSNTGALTVADSQFYQAKMLLAQQGLPKSAPDGDAMITNLPLGASRAVESQRLDDAREADLARTIEAIDAVETAKVHIAGGTDSVFLRDQAKASASVMLRLRGGRSLSSAQVQAIVNLVATSVPGLTPDNVAVVDQSGDLLSKDGGTADDPTDKQVALQAKVEERYRQALETLLAPIVGSDNFTAEVHADLDFSQVASTKESYPNPPAPIVATEQGSWSNDSADGKTPGGVPGALANQPPAAAQIANSATNKAGQAPQANGPTAPGQAPGQASAAASSKTSESYNRTYQLGREVSVTQNQVGTLRRLTVAVALRDPSGKKRTPQEIQALTDLVKGAVGFDQQRGDIVALSSRSFEPIADAEKPSWYEAPWVSLVGRNAGAVVVVLILVFGLGRPLLKRRAAAAAEYAKERATRRAEMGQQIAALLSNEGAAPSSAGRITLDMIESAPGYAARADLIRNFVKQDPARAALVVRDLIRSDMPGGEKE